MNKKDDKFTRYQAKVLWCIRRKGGKCQKCNRDLLKYPWESDFHHKPGTKKKAAISQILTHNVGDLIEELDKCDLLCCRCHRTEHANPERYQKLLQEIESKCKNYHPTKWEELPEKEIITLATKGLSCREIADKLQESERSVRRVIRRVENRSKQKIIPTKIEKSSKFSLNDNDLIKCIESGMKQKEIAQKYSLTPKSIYLRVWRLRQQGAIT